MTDKKLKVHTYKPEQIDAQIDLVARDAKRLKDKIHALGVACLKVLHDSKGDTEVAKQTAERLTKLQNASPYHANAFAHWIAEFTPFHFSEENSSWYVHVKEDNRIMGKVFIKARETPFWELKPASKPSPYNMWEDLQRVVARIEKKSETPGTDEDVVDVSVLKGLRELLKNAPA